VSGRDELASLVQRYASQTPADWLYDDEAKHIADAILAAGYRKLEPAWLESLEHDATHEFTETSHCDGEHIARWRRTPKLTLTVEAGPWEIVEPEPQS